MPVDEKSADAEYERLVAELHSFTEHRNSLLTFAFTVVFAALGVVIAGWNSGIPAWVCLLPLFLTVPFCARVSYYRIASAHRTAFLEVCYPDRQRFSTGSRIVKEGEGLCYNIMAFLVNTEMAILSLACVVFYTVVKLGGDGYLVGGFVDGVALLLGASSLAVTIAITALGFPYRSMKEDFSSSWRSSGVLGDDVAEVSSL